MGRDGCGEKPDEHGGKSGQIFKEALLFRVGF